MFTHMHLVLMEDLGKSFFYLMLKNMDKKCTLLLTDADGELCFLFF